MSLTKAYYPDEEIAVVIYDRNDFEGLNVTDRDIQVAEVALYDDETFRDMGRDILIEALARELAEQGEELGECDTCGSPYPLASRDGRCGDCGDCRVCCKHLSSK
jgi:hypothetical protein